MNLDDIYRLLQNIIRLGTVAEVRHKRPARVRVQTGDLLTAWRPWVELRAGDTNTWNPPTVGEQVVLLSPGGDLASAIVLTGVDQDAIPHPSENSDETVTLYRDGAREAYNHATGALTITGIKSLYVEAADSVHFKTKKITLDAPQSTSTGKHTVEDLLSYLAGMAGKNGKGNKTTITGDITHVGGDLSSNGVVVHLHVHTGVQPGGSNTGGPAQ